MVDHDREQERRRKRMLIHVIRKRSMPSKNRLTVILNHTKPKSIPGFDPGLLRQKAVTLPLAPSPLPKPKSTLVD